MLGIVRGAIKTLRTVDQQLQQVLDIAHPGPLAAAAQRWSQQDKQRAERAVERALDNWYTKHGAHESRSGFPPRPTASSSTAAQKLFLALSAPLALSQLVSAATPLSASTAATAEGILGARLYGPTDNLFQPSYLAPWDPKLIYYPRWMFGQYKVHSTFVNIKIPLGSRFVPEGFLQAANAPAENGGIGSTYDYSLRYYSTLPDTFSNNAKFMLGLGNIEDAIIADKKFNTKSMTDAFLGYKGAVQSVEFDPTDAPLRQTVTLSNLGPDMAPLPPRRLELYVNALKSEYEGENVFRTSELARQVLLGVRRVEVTDYEVMNEYKLVSPGKVTGRQRSLLYLNPQDPLYFKTGGKAIAVYDYEFEMERLPPPGDAPTGAVACVLTPKGVDQCL